jgi:hypothetical protein
VAISKSGYVLSDFRQNDHRMSVRENITFFSGTLRICRLPGGLLERVFWQMQFHVFSIPQCLVCFPQIFDLRSDLEFHARGSVVL